MKKSFDRLSPSQVRRIDHQLRIDREFTQPDIDRANRAFREASLVPPGPVRRLALAFLVLLVLVAVSVLGNVLAGGASRSPAFRSPVGDPFGAPSPTPASVRSQALAAALDHGIPPRIFEALILTESSWRVDVRGAAGEVGLTQLLPSTARDLGVDAHDVSDNLVGGARHLRAQFDRTGDWAKALAAYNGRGPRARAYARRVLRAASTGDEE